MGKEEVIEVLSKFGLINKDVAHVSSYLGGQMRQPTSLPPDVLADPENQIVAKDMTLQVLREDAKAHLAGELESAWSYVALFAVVAAKLVEGLAPPGLDPLPKMVPVDGDKLEQLFAEFEFKRTRGPEGLEIAVIRVKTQKAVLKIPIKLPQGAVDPL